MNWDFRLFLTAAITWTVIGAIFLPLTGWLSPRLIKNAACRHRTWGLVFGGLFLVPIFQLANSTVAACRPPSTSISPSILGGAWILGTLFMLGRFALAWMRLQTLRRQSSAFHSESVDIPGLRHGGGVFEKLEIRISPTQEPRVPITWGCWEPVVLLPKSANDWPGTRLAAVLLHEFGHVRRRDHLMQTFALLVCAIHWFNPFFWRAARKMEVDAEIAADDCAILAGLRPSSYAAELLHFAAQLAPQPRSRTWIGTAMAKEFTVENRLRAILEPASVRGPIGFWRAAMVNALVLLLFISAGLSMKSLPVGGQTSQGPAPSCRR
ncbi:MAG TPA: M56 family metallopeptidase [Candidatus Limnocylindria bacterium]|jgi:beta-lactamase regulating signal transducer with metallopeptidase domain|nr:M56 family metallopeptidase [Candidatus Limnocylindria bacterium]